MPRRGGPGWPVALALLGVLVWARIFTTWFVQDDFTWMLRAQGHAPLAARRFLSMRLCFGALLDLFGPRPAPFHAATLAFHLTTGLLIHRILAGRLGAGVAVAAAAMFLASPALFDALHWISDLSDPMCGAFLAAAVWLLSEHGGRGRAWLAVGAYALALGSKEIAVGALPVLVLLQARSGGRTAWLRATLCVALAGLATALMAVAGQMAAGEAYGLAPAAALRNLPGYAAAGVLAGTAFSSASDLAWARQAWVQAAGWGILAAWLFALIARRSGPAWLGFLWFVGLLAPVLMFERQFYLYYLYCALPGLLASAAFLVGGGSRRLAGRAVRVGVALIIAQAAAIEARSGSRLRTVPLPTDFVIRRAGIARNAVGDLKPHAAALRPRVVLLGQQPVEASSRGSRTTSAIEYVRDPWLDENVGAALSDGEAVRVMFPRVREAEFKPWLEDRDTASTVAAYRYDGHLEVSDYAPFMGVRDLDAPASRAEHMERASRFIGRRLFLEALRELLAARDLAPDDPDVLLNLGALQAHMGDSTAAAVSLSRAVQVAPGDMESLYNLGLLQWRLGRPADARATWAPLLRGAPGSDLAESVRALLEGRAR